MIVDPILSVLGKANILKNIIIRAVTGVQMIE